MPLFDWQAARGSPVVTHRFWIYWAITIPLTIVVVAIWFVWIAMKASRHAREDKAAGIGAQPEASEEKSKDV